MAGQQQNQQGQSNNNNKKQQPEVKVFIGPPDNGAKLVIAGKDEGKYDVTVNLGQSRQPSSNEVAVKVYANDIPIGGVLMVKTPANQTIQNVKLDPTKEVIFSVKRVGQEKMDDFLSPVNLSQVKKDVSTLKVKKHFNVIVGPLTPNRKQTVTFETYDENFNKAKGTVMFSLGQDANIDGADENEDYIHTSETGDGSSATLPLGRCSVVIKLKTKDATITFTHLESGEVIDKSLLFEP